MSEPDNNYFLVLKDEKLEKMSLPHSARYATQLEKWSVGVGVTPLELHRDLRSGKASVVAFRIVAGRVIVDQVRLRNGCVVQGWRHNPYNILSEKVIYQWQWQCRR